MNRVIVHHNQPCRKSMIPPPNEGRVQMSPFSDERWDIDAEENRRRREIHRNYVLGNFMTAKKCAKPPPRPEEPPKKVSIPKQVKKLEPEIKKLPEPQKKFYKFQQKEVYKPKTWADLKFESPKPPALYPLLKFPDKKPKNDEIFKLFKPEAHPVVVSVPGKATPPPTETAYEIPPIPQFSSGPSPKPEHYGTYLPFWEFSSKTYNK